MCLVMFRIKSYRNHGKLITLTYCPETVSGFLIIVEFPYKKKFRFILSFSKIEKKNKKEKKLFIRLPELYTSFHICL